VAKWWWFGMVVSRRVFGSGGCNNIIFLSIEL
jgi:hypothetical protein